MGILKKTCFRWWLVLLLLVFNSAAVNAQTTLELVAGVTGTLSAGESQQWSFTARDGQVLSFVMRTTSGDLDPVLTILTPTGAVLMSNDDYDYPQTREPLLEAIAMQSTGTYTAVVSAFGDTSGEYSLLMLPGYANIITLDDFTGSAIWETVDDSELAISISDETLAVSLDGIAERGVALALNSDDLSDYYTQVDVVNVGGEGDWMVGLTARQQNPQNYYVAMVNSAGQWRFVLHTLQNEIVLRDWTSHPAIVPGETAFSMALLINGANFQFFYDGQFVGQVSDSSFTSPGQSGVYVETSEVLNARISAQLDNFVLTLPLQTTSGGVFPQQVIVSSPTTMVQELERRRLIPSGGTMALTLDESFGQSVSTGVAHFMLGRGLTLTNFVFATTVTVQGARSGQTGCGLIVRQQSETDYTLAYLDQTGAYALARRVGEGFEPGVFGQNPALATGAHQLLVVASDEMIHYYIDGQHVGALDAEAVEGAIGNAVVNYEAIDTTCQFNDIWLWRWEP